MNYEIAISPELDLSAAEVAASWNASAEAKALATAQVKEAGAVSFGDPLTMTVLLMGGSFAAGVAANVLTNVLTKVIEQKLFPADKPARELIKVTPITLPNGTTMFTVERV